MRTLRMQQAAHVDRQQFGETLLKAACGVKQRETDENLDCQAQTLNSDRACTSIHSYHHLRVDNNASQATDGSNSDSALAENDVCSLPGSKHHHVAKQFGHALRLPGCFL